MNNIELIKNLNELKNNYGDLTISELINAIENHTKNVDINHLRMDYTIRFGRCCNELSGEYMEYTADNICELINEITGFYTVMINTPEYEEDKENFLKINEFDEEYGIKLMDKLAASICNGFIGDEDFKNIKLTFLDRKPSLKEVVDYLESVRVYEDGLNSLKDLLC